MALKDWRITAEIAGHEVATAWWQTFLSWSGGSGSALSCMWCASRSRRSRCSRSLSGVVVVAWTVSSWQAGPSAACNLTVDGGDFALCLDSDEPLPSNAMLLGHRTTCGLLSIELTRASRLPPTFMAITLCGRPDPRCPRLVPVLPSLLVLCFVRMGEGPVGLLPGGVAVLHSALVAGSTGGVVVLQSALLVFSGSQTDASRSSRLTMAP